jgi:hypothetical protein
MMPNSGNHNYDSRFVKIMVVLYVAVAVVLALLFVWDYIL